MIEKLTNEIDLSDMSEHCPDNWEISKKVNEIIDYLNEREHPLFIADENGNINQLKEKTLEEIKKEHEEVFGKPKYTDSKGL